MRDRVIVTLGLAALMLACLWIYWPGTDGPVLLDDVSNLRTNLAGEGAADAAPPFRDYVLGNRSSPVGRPLSMVTFYADYFLPWPRVKAGKTLNIALHLLNGLLLYGFLRRLGRQVGMVNDAAFLFAAGLWLLAPLAVSTVLYHVQRMAILAAMFSLLALHAWLSLHAAVIAGRRPWWRLAAWLLSILAAVLAKENAVPVALLSLLLGLLVLLPAAAGAPQAARLRRWLLGALGAGLLALLAVLLLGGWQWIVDGYAPRTFDLGERLLTQTRVIGDYAAQFFVPDIARMGLAHDDFPVSRGLLDPPATLWMLSAWVLVASLLLAAQRLPMGRPVAFGLLFFLLMHSVESSVLALEIYFEHRNYLPSLGLSISVAFLLAGLGRRLPQTCHAVLGLAAVYLVAHAAALASQVNVWTDRTSIAVAEIAAHPESARANRAMAVVAARAGHQERGRHDRLPGRGPGRVLPGSGGAGYRRRLPRRNGASRARRRCPGGQPALQQGQRRRHQARCPGGARGYPGFHGRRRPARPRRRGAPS
jgi:hypothetical protein